MFIECSNGAKSALSESTNRLRVVLLLFDDSRIKMARNPEKTQKANPVGCTGKVNMKRKLNETVTLLHEVEFGGEVTQRSKFCTNQNIFQFFPCERERLVNKIGFIIYESAQILIWQPCSVMQDISFMNICCQQQRPVTKH